LLDGPFMRRPLSPGENNLPCLLPSFKIKNNNETLDIVIEYNAYSGRASVKILYFFLGGTEIEAYIKNKTAPILYQNPQFPRGPSPMELIR